MDDDLRKQLVLWLITHDAMSRDEPPHGAASSSDSLFYFNIEYRIKYFNLRILAKLITKDRNIKYIRNESRINDFGNQLKNAIGLVLSGDYCVEGNEQMICISSDEDAALVVMAGFSLLPVRDIEKWLISHGKTLNDFYDVLLPSWRKTMIKRMKVAIGIIFN
jgi:hypothetical protein